MLTSKCVCAVIVVGTLVRRGTAYANFVRLIPNGVQGQPNGHDEWHARAWGHTLALPDATTPQVPFARNDFGRDFFKAGRAWTRELCMADSDGDGMSNGEELGDPDCVWQVGQTPSHNQMTHPGIPDNPKSWSDQAHLDLPSAFVVSGGGFMPANGMYVLVNESVAAYAWAKREIKPYLWKSKTADCVLHHEMNEQWGISCYGDHVYRGGGNGSLPLRPGVVRSGSQAWERGVPPAPDLEPLYGEYFAPGPVELPTEGLNALPFPSLVLVAIVLIGRVLAWRCAWLPDLRWNLVIGMFFFLGCGAELGNHRFLSHRAFRTGFLGKHILCLAGGMTMQDAPIVWASMHRVHHRACDLTLDFHSPVYADRGFLFAHEAWLHTPREHVPKLSYSRVEDIADDDDLWLANYLHPVEVAFGYLLASLFIATCVTLRYKVYRQSKFQLPALAVYYLSMYGVLPIFMTWHVVMMVNSGTHIWGERPFVDGMMPHVDSCESRNMAWALPIMFGANFHNNHHAAPSSASNWVEWHQVDFFFLFLRAMEALGLVWDVRIELPAATRPGYEAGSGLSEIPIIVTYACLLTSIIVWKVQRRNLNWLGF